MEDRAKLTPDEADCAVEALRKIRQATVRATQAIQDNDRYRVLANVRELETLVSIMMRGFLR